MTVSEIVRIGNKDKRPLPGASDEMATVKTAEPWQGTRLSHQVPPGGPHGHMPPSSALSYPEGEAGTPRYSWASSHCPPPHTTSPRRLNAVRLFTA